MTHNSESTARLESQVRTEVQVNHSSPPSFYAHVFSTILSDPQLTAQWLVELEATRTLVQIRREHLVRALIERCAPSNLLNLAKQKGIFGWSGFTRDQCHTLTEKFGIYLPSNDRVCISAIPDDKIDKVADSLLAGSISGLADT